MFDPEAFEKSKYGNVTVELDKSINYLLDLMIWTNCEYILDYGCGPGSIAQKYFGPKAKQFDSIVHCVDISEIMIQHAKKKNNHENVKYFVGDIMSNGYFLKDQNYDKIFAIHLLNWFPNPKIVMEKFYNQLNPEGYLGIIVGSSGFFHNKLVKAIATDPKWAKYMNDYQKFDYMYMYDNPDLVLKYYTDTLSSLGFELIDCSHKKGGLDAMKFCDIIGLYKSLNPYLNKIPLNLTNEFEKDYEKYIRSFLNFGLEVENNDVVCHPLTTYLSAVVKKN